MALQSSTLWYKRLGHPSPQGLRILDILKNNNEVEVLHKCTVCPLAKQTRLSYPDSDSRSFIYFELVHMDLWVPYKTPTFDNKCYLLSMVDDHSRYT